MLKLTIKGLHTSIKDDLNKYVYKKLGRLDKYLSRKARATAHADVYLKEFMIKQKKQCSCEVVLHLPQEEFVVTETTMNIFAAVDIVEEKLKNHIKKYKWKHNSRSRLFRLMRRNRRKNPQAD